MKANNDANVSPIPNFFPKCIFFFSPIVLEELSEKQDTEAATDTDFCLPSPDASGRNVSTVSGTRQDQSRQNMKCMHCALITDACLVAGCAGTINATGWTA